MMHLYCYCLTQHNNLLTSWLKKKNWPTKWGGHGRPGRCGSVTLAVYQLEVLAKYKGATRANSED